MVPAVDVAGLAVFHVIGEQRRQLRSLRDPHFVRDVMARLAAPSGRARRSPGWGCPGSACRPSRRSAPACRGRSPGAGMPACDRGARQLDLERVAAGFGGLERGVRRLAVQLRIDVAAAGQHQRRRRAPGCARASRRRRRLRPVRRRRGGPIPGSRPCARFWAIAIRAMCRQRPTSAPVRQRPSDRARASAAAGNTPPRRRASGARRRVLR